MDLVAGLLKSGNKKAISSNFVPETEKMRYRVKMVQFKTVNYDTIQDMNDAIKNRCDLQHKIVWFMLSLLRANQNVRITSDFKMDITKWYIAIDEAKW